MVYKILVTYRYRITGKRLFNLIQVVLSIDISKILKRPVVWGYPLILMVEPTNLCNLHCPMCPSGAGVMNRSRGKMDIKKFINLIDEVGDYLILVQFWNQGEPFIHPGLSEMVSAVKSKGIPAVTSTNGHYFNTYKQVASIIESGIDEIIISFDGIDQKTYEKYRVGGKFDQVIRGIELLVQYKIDQKIKRPLINLQFLVFRHNEDQIQQIQLLGKRLGADLMTLKSAQVYSDNQGQEFLPDNEKFRRYVYNGKAYRIKSQFPNWCQLLWTVCVVNWNGSVVPCCFDKDGDYTVANLYQERKAFREIWREGKMRSFRNRVMRNRSGIPVCMNCFEGIQQPYSYYQVI